MRVQVAGRRRCSLSLTGLAYEQTHTPLPTQAKVYDRVSDFCQCLCVHVCHTHVSRTYVCRYQGTGKQFFIGMWEGDHALRKPGQWGHSVPPDVDRIETLQFVVQEKQRAVDNAKRDLGDRCTDVSAGHMRAVCWCV